MNKKWLSPALIAALIAASVLTFSCRSESDSKTVYSLVSSVSIAVELNGSPTLSNQNGDVFTLDEAYGVLYSVRFSECSQGKSLLPQSIQIPFLGSAYAGHSDILIPTNWKTPTHIDFLNPSAIYQIIEFQEQSICDAVVTWARWDGGTFNLPNPEPESTYSVYVSGSCVPPTETEEIEFILQTSVPSEVVQPLNGIVDSGQFTALYFQLDIDLSDMLEDVVCSNDLLDNPDTNALQILFNLQQSSLWTSEWQ